MRFRTKNSSIYSMIMTKETGPCTTRGPHYSHDRHYIMHMMHKESPSLNEHSVTHTYTVRTCVEDINMQSMAAIISS